MSPSADPSPFLGQDENFSEYKVKAAQDDIRISDTTVDRTENLDKPKATKTELMLMQNQSAETFSYGSSYTRVAKIHGPPDRTEGNIWHYGESRITFVEGTVSDWYSHPSYPLSARKEAL